MGGLILWLVIAVPILAAIQIMWPVIVFFAGLWLLLQAMKGCYGFWRHKTIVAAATRRAVVARADAQHAAIMRGDIVAGTYGNYQPPKGLA
jgi:hypothetical protein